MAVLSVDLMSALSAASRAAHTRATTPQADLGLGDPPPDRLVGDGEFARSVDPGQIGVLPSLPLPEEPVRYAEAIPFGGSRCLRRRRPYRRCLRRPRHLVRRVPMKRYSDQPPRKLVVNSKTLFCRRVAVPPFSGFSRASSGWDIAVILPFLPSRLCPGHSLRWSRRLFERDL